MWQWVARGNISTCRMGGGDNGVWQWVARGNISTCRMGAGDDGCGSGLLGVT